MPSVNEALQVFFVLTEFVVPGPSTDLTTNLVNDLKARTDTEMTARFKAAIVAAGASN